MRGGSWLVGGLLMILMAVAVVALITTGARWLLPTGQDHAPPAPAQSGPLPDAFADERKRHERARFLWRPQRLPRRVRSSRSGGDLHAHPPLYRVAPVVE